MSARPMWKTSSLHPNTLSLANRAYLLRLSLFPRLSISTSTSSSRGLRSRGNCPCPTSGSILGFAQKDFSLETSAGVFLVGDEPTYRTAEAYGLRIGLSHRLCRVWAWEGLQLESGTARARVGVCGCVPRAAATRASTAAFLVVRVRMCCLGSAAGRNRILGRPSGGSIYSLGANRGTQTAFIPFSTFLYLRLVWSANGSQISINGRLDSRISKSKTPV
jgi:hypothetical protein